MVWFHSSLLCSFFLHNLAFVNWEISIIWVVVSNRKTFRSWRRPEQIERTIAIFVVSFPFHGHEFLNPAKLYLRLRMEWLHHGGQTEYICVSPLLSVGLFQFSKHTLNAHDQSLNYRWRRLRRFLLEFLNWILSNAYLQKITLHSTDVDFPVNVFLIFQFDYQELKGR